MIVCSLSYPASKAHAPYYIAICGLIDSTILFHFYLIKTQFSGKKIYGIENKCFDFPYI